MKIGYIRPFQDDPNVETQEKNLKNMRCQKIYIEEHASAKKRIQLDRMLDNLEKGDRIVVTKLYSLADSTIHLVEILHIIEGKGASLITIQEGIDTSKPINESFHTIVKHLAAFQRDVISEKTKKGLNKAKQKGISAGRPRKPDENVQRAIMMYESKKYSLEEIRNETGISKSTLYRYLES